MKKILNFILNEIRAIRHSIQNSYREAPLEMQKGLKRAIGLSLVAVILFILWDKGSAYFEEKHMAEEIQKGPRIKIAKAILSPAERTVSVLGEAKPFAAVTLYSKVSGYLKQVKVDKGDIVKKGQVLAIIESPETDRAYEGARANARNKKAIADRIATLLKRDLVSAQEAETARSDAEVEAAQFASQEVLKSYETIRAPFDGTITARYADPGALVQNATSSQTSALPLLSISQVNQLRVYVYLDQRDATYVASGTAATVSLTEKPDLIINGHIERVSGQLDEKTRMLLAEVDLENNNGQIVPGSLVQVSLNLKTPPGVIVPVEALVLKDGSPVVPIVDANNEVTFAPVKVADNDGKFVKIQEGVKEGQNVALNLGNTVQEHGKVRPILDSLPVAAGGK